MSETIDYVTDPIGRYKPGGFRLISLALIALTLCVLPLLRFFPTEWRVGVGVVGASLLVTLALVLIANRVAGYAARDVGAVLKRLVQAETTPSVVTDATGAVLFANQDAAQKYRTIAGARLDDCLRSVFANPSAVLFRLQSRASRQGQAQEGVATKGRTVPITVTDLGGGRMLWRIADEDRSPWSDVPFPVVTLGRGDSVLAMNAAASAALDIESGALDAIADSCRGCTGQMLYLPTAQGFAPVALSEIQRVGAVRDILILPLQDQPRDPEGPQIGDLPVPVIRLSPTGEIRETNRLAARLIGEVGKGATYIDQILQGLGGSVQDWLAQTAERDSAPRSEFLRLARKDKEVFVQVTLSRTMYDGQVSLIAVLNDATELKTLEAQFVQGQKMQAVGQLAGGVAHDFNNLLTAISGHCDLLLLRHEESDPDYGDLVQINQNANRAAALVSQLLAFSRKQTLRPEVLDLRDTISDLIHLLNRLVGEKVRLTLSHDPVLKPVQADKRQLEQVLMNLVVNARDAMPNGGEIRIETEVVMLARPLLRDRATVLPGEYVTVKVIDSGVGIPADKLQKVFEPFFTTKRTGEGTGLGLSTAYGIVKQTGGFIFVDSVEGRGTEFSVYLPVCPVVEAPEPAKVDVPAVQSAHQGEGVVLLVEDEAPVRAFATRALRLKGYTVFEADSAETALSLLEDGDLKVDVFVTDVVMPGMDGPTWVREAMKTRPDVRVIFMSGYTEGAFGTSGPDVPNSAFLPKPFSLNQLTEAVFQQMN